MTKVRTIIAIIASQNWPLHQMDVKNAFLHGDLKEDIYMKTPPGLFSSATTNVCKLKQSLYGLKQAPRAWFDKFQSTLLLFSFEQSKYDSSLFLRKTTTGVFLNQRKYTQDLIALAGLQESSSVNTPLELNVKYCRAEGNFLPDPTLYRQFVGSLNYLTIARRYISFAVQQLSQFMQAQHHLHLVAVQHIIQYLLGTSTRGLFFPSGSEIQFNAFSDSDWAGFPATQIGFAQSNPTPLHADNTSAIHIATNQVYHERTKHIEVD
ncbi:uncharacterized mitochondrial protein AtMg00810-like [Solanum tuberosum]|uniref:uncharacterized mitochondrial protein AtMg00810-like n=1 Tax=Solanum tuberosum TaxID=4113 RepID=UPI00073A00C8|nr:PREDICTED: uncharacterized mitochondrial protein AtMg00810-like [Solanum tuberosum]